MGKYFFQYVEVQEVYGDYKLFMKIEPWSYLGTYKDKMQAMLAANCVETAMKSFTEKGEIQ